MGHSKILFLYLSGFSRTGGIEKFNRAFCKALGDVKTDVCIYSAYDDVPDLRYLANSRWRGFAGNRWLFVVNSVRHAVDHDLIILGHINLALVGLAIRWLFPQKKIWLIAHGMDVWFPLGFFKRQLLATIDLVLSVSEFTKQKMVRVHGFSPAKIALFPNTLDPFWPIPVHFDKPSRLARSSRPNLPSRVILTVARLRFREQYKGYDQVLAAMYRLKQRDELGEMHYLIVGQADRQEVAVKLRSV